MRPLWENRSPDGAIEIAAFYRFVSLPDYERIQKPLQEFCNAHGMKGTILLAREGINSTISGTREAMAAFFAYLDNDPRLANLERKTHYADDYPFQRMKVRLKQEIVRMGVTDLDPTDPGDYVESAEWDKLIAEQDVVVVDTRNKYEVALGTFDGAVNPETDDFRSFPKWVEENLDPAKHKKVAMYCTGGIRCEKSTALLKQMGFEAVYHLKGGILQYLADTGNQSGKWKGSCFVFDERLAVDETLAPVSAPHCPTCNKELSMDEIRWLSEGTVLGCSHCGDQQKAAEKLGL